VAIGAIAVSLAPHDRAAPDILKGWMNGSGVATEIKYQSAKGDQVELEFDSGRMSREEIAGQGLRLHATSGVSPDRGPALRAQRTSRAP
jgi:hypothetical protein